MAEPTPFRMTDAKAVQLVKEICAESSRVILTDHARQRMRQRRFTLPQVIDCLRKGTQAEPVALDAKGNWKLTMERRAGGRHVRVAAAIDLPARVIVITVY